MAPFLRSGVRAHSDCHSGEGSAVRRWQQTFLVLITSWIVVLFSFRDAAIGAVAVWRASDTFSHGFLVVPIVAYMIWGRHRQILSVTPTPNYWGFPILFLLGIGWLLGDLASVIVIQQLAVVGMLQVLVFTVAGWSVTRVLLFPLGFLFFAVPIGEDLVRPMQDYTALFTVKALQLTGIPVYRDGWTIVIPSGIWEVAEACAGVRYVIPSVILGCFFSYFTYYSWRRRLAFVLLCFFGAIIANGVRAYGIVMLAHLTDNRLAVGVDHLIAGWIFFSVVMFLLFCIGLRWRDREPTGAGDGGSILEGKVVPFRRSSPKAMLLTAVFGVGLLTTPLVLAEILFPPDPTEVPPTIFAPRVAHPWQILTQYDDPWSPRFIGADTKLLRTYSAGDRRVHLFVAYYYGYQRQGDELITGENTLFDSKQWSPVSAGSIKVMLEGQPVFMNQNVVRSNNRTRLIWSSYWAGGMYTANPYVAKALEVKTVLLREKKGSAMIAVAVDVVNGGLAEAAETLQNFLAHVILSEILIAGNEP
jgi:exosortase A